MDKLLHSPRIEPVSADSVIDSASIGEMIEQSLGFIRRQYPIIVSALACTIALGIAYLITTAPLYTAHARLMLDTGKLQVLPQQQQTYSEFPLDNSQVATQIELLKSDTIGLSVVKELKLTKVAEFVELKPSFADKILSLVLALFDSRSAALAPAQASENELMRRALDRYLAHREVVRVGRTYVLDISYASSDPERAATIANGIAQAYI